MVFGGDVLSQMKFERPFSPSSGELRVINDSQLTPTFGTGIHTVTPAHNVESLRLSYAYDLSREGCVNPQTGNLTQPMVLEGASIYDKNLLPRLRRALTKYNQFFATFKHQCSAFKTIQKNIDDSVESINLVTVDAWFVKLSEKLKFQCFRELATVKFSPELNTKTTEQTAVDLEKAKKKRGKELDDLGSYYINVAEELNDFDEWCISEKGIWGIPIPYFVRTDTGEILCDSEIARHVADIFKEGGSDQWYQLSVKELLPSRYHEQASFLAKGSQLFDVWFDNSLSWDFALKQDAHSESQITHTIRNELESKGMLQPISEMDQLTKAGGRRTGKNSLQSYLQRR